MKYKLDWMEHKTSSSGTAYIKATVTDEAGITTENVAVFSSFPGFNELAPGHSVEGILKEKDYQGKKSYSLDKEIVVRPPGARPNMDRIMDKKANLISEAQQRKEQSIAAAQDRTAWMWAKNNASELLAGTFTSEVSNSYITECVIELATKIYNGEPTEPFSSR
jgi:hypothetical protein